MATLEYKGYVAQLEIDEENNGFHGRVINISDVVNFKGSSMAELKREFAKSMQVYFAAFCTAAPHAAHNLPSLTLPKAPG